MVSNNIKKYIEGIDLMLHHPDEPFKSSPRQVEKFLSDVTWGDMQMFILDRVKMLRERLEDEQEVDNIRLMQGGIAELKAVLTMPVMMIEHIKLDEENKEVERKLKKEGDNHAEDNY